MKKIFAYLLISLFYFNLSAATHSPIAYYGEEFYKALPELIHPHLYSHKSQNELNSLSGNKIKKLLFKVLSSDHKKVQGGLDIISKKCQGQDCYRHTKYSYKQARQFMMGHLYLEGSHSENYSIESYYCLKTFTNGDFGSKKPLGPNRIPNHNVLNTEHLWPQSRFNSSFSKTLQKSDLHSLRPVMTRVNSSRSNLPFGEIDELTKSYCQDTGSGVGYIHGLSGKYFEPPHVHKGNIARALFYFAVRYKLNIPADQETFLRKWHQQDPVDQEEVDLHEEVFNFQKDRNPFIDFPELVQKVKDL